MVETSETTSPELAQLAARLRTLRTARGWTLEELAERTGLSRAFLSRLEGGDRQPSIAAILTLSRVFDVSMGALFEPPQSRQACLIVRRSERRVRPGDGIRYVSLSSTEQFANLQPIHLTVSPSRKGDERYQHEGEEWVYVLSGKLRLLLGEKQFNLEEGDAAHFDSRVPHRLVALGSKDAQALVVACPLPEGAVSANAPRSRRAIVVT